jgi:hypothetical protein
MGLAAPVIVLLCILGAACFAMACYAVARTFGFDDASDDINRSDQQEEYMRGVRRQNFAKLRAYAQTRGRDQRVV